MMKKLFFYQNKDGSSQIRYAYKSIFLLLLSLFCTSNLLAQASSYQFEAPQGSYVPNSEAATPISGLITDDALTTTPIDIGFEFMYEGVTYTQFKMSSNGFITFKVASTGSIHLNNFATVTNDSKPIIAPLWDDLGGATNANSATSIEVTGTSPNQVATIEWKNFKWNRTSDAAISFQIKLYQTTNVIEFVYKQEAGALVSPSATIGIGSAVGTGAGSFLNLINLTDFATTSSESVVNINIKPQTGQIFRFTPPTCLSPNTLAFQELSSNSVDISWQGDGATYELQYSDVAFNPSNNEGTLVSNITSTQHSLSNLTQGTTFYVYVRSNCAANDDSNWAGPITFTTHLLNATLPFTESFDGSNIWVLKNGTQANKWFIGSTQDGSVDESLYISSDEGLNNNYVNTTSVVQVYKDFEIPSGTTNIDVAFDWKTIGQSNAAGTTQNDYFQAWIVPVDFAFTPGTLISTGDGRIKLGNINLNGSADFTTSNFVADVSTFESGVFRLVFQWRNDASTANPPAAVIDNLEINITTCNPVNTLATAANIDSSSAEISWVSNGANFDIFYGVAGTPQEDWILQENVYSGTILTNLLPATFYQLMVRENCGEGEVSIWSALSTFKTTQFLPEIPYTEDFETTSHSWEYANPTSATGNKWIVSSQAFQGSNGALYVSNDNGITNAYTITTSTTAYAYKDIAFPSGAQSLDVTFDIRVNGERSSSAINDYVNVWMVPQSFTPEAGTAITAAAGSKILIAEKLVNIPEFTTITKVVDVSGFTEENFRLVIEWKNNYGTGTQPPGAIDNISIIETACNPVSDLTLSDLTHESATLSWESQSETSEIIWGTVGFNPLEDQAGSESNATSPFTVTGLDQSTEYHMYVRAICGDVNSALVGPITVFTTQIPATLPFTQDFESEDHNFTLKNGALSNKWFVGYYDQEVSNSALFISGDNGVTNSYTHGTGISIVHAYRDIEIPVDAVNVDLSFDWKAGGESTHDYLRVWLAPTEYSPTTGTLMTATETNGLVLIQNGTIPRFNLSPTFTNFATVENVEAFAGQTMRLIFEWRNDGATGNNAVSGTIDNVSLSITACDVVTNLSTSDATINSATLNWESEGNAFELEYGAVGFVVGEGILISNITTTSYALSNLEENSTYEFYVRKVCGNENSIWTGPHRFYTGYCTPVGSTERYIVNFTTEGGYVNINNTTNTSTGYGDYTSMIVAQSPGEEITLKITPTSGTHFFYVWVDLNNDFDFNDEGETIVATTSYSGNYTSAFIIPADLPLGSYRLRIANSFSGAITSSCGPASSGEFEDYTLEIIDIPACSPPTELNASVNSFTSVELSWTGEGNAYDIQWGEKGFTLGEGTLVENHTSTSYTLSNLDEETAYQFYVRLDCGNNSVSYWTGPYDFFTGYCVPTLTNTTSTSYTINGVSTTGGYININNLANGISTGNYGNFHAQAVAQSPGGSISYNVARPAYTNVEIWIDLDQNFIFDETELVAAHVYTSSTGNFTGTIVVPEDLPFGDYRIRIRSRYYSGSTATPCGALVYGETEDYTLSVVSAPTCDIPTALTAAVNDATTATLSWEGSVNSFEIVTGVKGFNANNATPIALSSNSYVFTGESGIMYDYFVKQVCNAENKSFWAGPYSFNVGYCVPTGASTYHITNVTITGGAQDINNSTASSPGKYGNYSSMVCEQAAGETLNISITPSTGTNKYYIWVDWNNDFDFADAGEEIVATTVFTYSYSDTYTIPANQAIGSYRMRIANSWSGNITSGCGHAANGEFEDYTLVVTDGLSVANPTINKLTYYPNPVQDILNISNNSEIENVQVYNMLGQVVLNKSINATSSQLDLSNLSSGTYMVKMSINNAIETIKIIKK